MRTVILSVLALAIGTSLGLGATWLEFRGVGEHFNHISRTKAGTSALADESTPPLAVVVGGSTYDFGVMNFEQSREKSFVIRNDGGQPLVVSWLRGSCGMCIQNNHKFTTETVPPGGTCEVIVTYSAKKEQATFNESAHLSTNDPTQSELVIRISGAVVKAVRTHPEELALGSVLSSETTSATVKVVGYETDQLELIEKTFSNPSTASLFDLTTRPLTTEELSEFEHAKTGLELKLAMKPGLPIGPISQTLKLKAKTGESSVHDVKTEISGTVVGDLSLIGRNVNANESTFSIGLVSREKGVTAEFFVMVKGPHREDVKLSVAKVDPEFMKVEIGEPTKLSDGRVVRHTIKVTVPKGAPVTSRLGNSQGEAGQVLLHTTHPTSKELPVKVRLAVE